MASLADDDAEQNISRAFVPYAPLYPTFQESLNRFRRGERSELLHRGAERIVHNVGLYDTRRSSEDRGADIPVILEEAMPPGPSEERLEAEGEQGASPYDNETQPYAREEPVSPHGDTNRENLM